MPKALAASLHMKGYRLVSGGTDNHLMLVDLRSKGMNGKQAQEILDQAGITVNKNSIPFDTEVGVQGGRHSDRHAGSHDARNERGGNDGDRRLDRQGFGLGRGRKCFGGGSCRGQTVNFALSVARLASAAHEPGEETHSLFFQNSSDFRSEPLPRRLYIYSAKISRAL